MSAKKEMETYCVSFYTKENYALRENLIMKANHQTDGRLLRAAENKGRKLGAHHFHVFIIVPRRFVIPHIRGCQCEECCP